MKYLFFALSPLQVLLSKQIALKEKIEKNKVYIVTSHTLAESIEPDYNKIALKFPDLQDSNLKKISLTIFSYFNFKKKIQEDIEFDWVYIPSNLNVSIQNIYERTRYRNLGMYEEGGSLYYSIREQIYGSNQSVNNIIRKVLFLSKQNYFLKNDDIGKAYMFFPDFYISRVKESNCEIIDASELLYGIQSSHEGLELSECVDMIFFSQPLTQDGICNDNLEIQVLESFLKKNEFKTVYIKLHPRDSRDRYDSECFDTVKFINSNEPYQVLHSYYKPKSIASYFSSVLYSVPAISDEFIRYAVVNDLNDQGILNSVKTMKLYFEDLKVV